MYQSIAIQPMPGVNIGPGPNIQLVLTSAVAGGKVNYVTGASGQLIVIDNGNNGAIMGVYPVGAFSVFTPNL